MSKRNKNNSIIFLTTLSVYLGLVLVGAPAVLSQAALARSFDVRDEIEVKDDLDKKPDGWEELKNHAEEDFQFIKFDDESFSAYTEIVKNLIEASRQANPKSFSYSEKGKSGSGGEYRVQYVSFTRLAESETAPRQIFQTINRELKKLFLQFPVNANSFDANSFANFQSDERGFTLTTKFSQTDADAAQKLFAAFSADFERLKLDSSDKKVFSAVIENTQASVENSNFVITTRLPRGSLDALFVKSAK